MDKESLNFHLLKELSRSRKSALSQEKNPELAKQYKILRQEQKNILTYLFNEPLDRLPLLSWPHFNIIDVYDDNNKRYSSLIWSDSVFYEYILDIDKHEIVRSNTYRGYEQYPINPDVHVSLVEYFSEFNINDTSPKPPINGRSNNGYYVYSKVELFKDSCIATSYALQQR